MSGETLRGRSVFVTGAYGLLGSWLAKALVASGARTTVLRREAVVSSALELEEPNGTSTSCTATSATAR
jgi:CDP-glucose 4,6-dehydratase